MLNVWILLKYAKNANARSEAVFRSHVSTRNLGKPGGIHGVGGSILVTGY